MRFLYASIWIGTERPSVLFDLATAWLLDKKVLLPGVTTLTRLISTLRERVAERLWQRLSADVSPEQRTDLEGLLTRAGVSRITNLERLRRAPWRYPQKGKFLSVVFRSINTQRPHIPSQ
jgi:hypothetical protein